MRKIAVYVTVILLFFWVGSDCYPETESVRVSGEITLRSFARNNFDMDNADPSPNQDGQISTDWATYLMSTAEIRIDADLTDNVSGVIKLVNQRIWGDRNYSAENIPGTRFETLWNLDENYNGTVRNVNPGADAFDVVVDLAYIELKEFLYSPLTLRIGRQDLWFGKGFIVGANIQDPSNSIFPMEYSAIRSFDAVRATLDYSPWTIDAVFSKISENARRADDDVNLWGVNAGYVFDSYNAEAETYWWFKQARNPGGGRIGTKASSVNGVVSNNVHVVGARGSFDPLEYWTVSLEGAYQFGDFMINNQTTKRDRSAWALDAILECRYWQDEFAWKPVLSAEYIFYSGQKDEGNNNRFSEDTMHYWDHMFRGKFDTAIREYQDWFYRTAQSRADNTLVPSSGNQHQALFRGTVSPTDSLTLEAVYAHFWWAERISPQRPGMNVGDEVDITLTWNYSEDLSFSLLTGCFFPGDYFQDGYDAVATDIVGSVTLSF